MNLIQFSLPVRSIPFSVSQANRRLHVGNSGSDQVNFSARSTDENALPENLSAYFGSENRMMDLAVLLRPKHSVSEIIDILHNYECEEPDDSKKEAFSNAAVARLRAIDTDKENAQNVLNTDPYAACLEGHVLLEKDRKNVPSLILVGVAYAKLAKNYPKEDKTHAIFIQRADECLRQAVESATYQDCDAQIATDKNTRVKAITHLLIGLMNRAILSKENPDVVKFDQSQNSDRINFYLNEILEIQHSAGLRSEVISKTVLEDMMKTGNKYCSTLQAAKISNHLLAALFHNYAKLGIFIPYSSTNQANKAASQLDSSVTPQTPFLYLLADEGLQSSAAK